MSEEKAPEELTPKALPPKELSLEEKAAILRIKIKLVEIESLLVNFQFLPNEMADITLTTRALNHDVKELSDLFLKRYPEIAGVVNKVLEELMRDTKERLKEKLKEDNIKPEQDKDSSFDA